MAIQLGNVIIAGTGDAEASLVSSAEPIVEPAPITTPVVREEISVRERKSDIRRNITPPDVTDADNPHVIVAGKTKKIGKTSAYMLDMLSLDD